jgi:hypothetical protein
MTYLIHKDDSEHIKQLLGGVYEDEAEFVKQLWQAVVARLRRRDATLVVLHLGGSQHVYGPYSTDSEAKKAMRQFIGAIGADVYGYTMPINAASALDLQPGDMERYAPTCAKCGHPKAIHGFPMYGCIQGIVLQGKSKPDVTHMCGCKE